MKVTKSMDDTEEHGKGIHTKLNLSFRATPASEGEKGTTDLMFVLHKRQNTIKTINTDDHFSSDGMFWELQYKRPAEKIVLPIRLLTVK